MREYCFRILTPPPVQWDEETTVEGLFWMESKQWNVGLLNELFSQEEVDLIRGIPLSLRNIADRRVWHFEKPGKFTVRSAYHVAKGMNIANGEEAASSSSPSNSLGESLWRKLWSAYVPGKVKVCVWRACLDSLPTRLDLSKKKVPITVDCVVCGGQVELAEHVLRDCHVARWVWFRGLGIKVESRHMEPFMNWLAHVQVQVSAPGFELCLLLIWSLWKHCNEVMWNGNILFPFKIILQ